MYLNDRRVEDPVADLPESVLDDGGRLTLRAGKKRHYRVLFA
jgi:hypothetical protein